MPATSQKPTTQDFLDAYGGAVSARRSAADVHRGSRYDVLGGVAAVLFQRVATKGSDEFRATYFDTAQDVDLDALMAKRFADVSPRVLTTKGQGSVTVSRPSTAAGGGKFLVGTRVLVAVGGATPVRVFEVAEETAVGASDAFRIPIPIQTADPGASIPLTVSSSDVTTLRFEDPVWDATWQINQLTCGAGTDREEDVDYRSRARAERVDRRLGYAKSITAAMQNAGAQRVALFASDFLGNDQDFGLNRIYVGDTSYASTPALLLACRLAVYGVCILGTAVQVLPMVQQSLSLSVQVDLWDTADHVARDAIKADVSNALLNYFSSRQTSFLWRVDAMQGVALRATRRQAQAVTIVPSASEPSIATLFNSSPLAAWGLDQRHITVSFA